MNLAPLDMSVRTSDGLTLKGVLTYPATAPGRGFPLAVLAHQYPGTRDTYAPLAADLLELGVATLAFDQRGHGASITGASGPVVVDTPEGFTAEAFGTAFMASASRVGFHHIDNDILRVASWGAVQSFIDAGRLLLVGASVGGTGVLLAAPDIAGLRAVITLGAAAAPVFGHDAPVRVRAAVERLKVPVYLASSREDAFDGAANAAAWSEGLSHATAKVVPGAAHAMAIYFDVRDEVLAVARRALA
jgi:dienelactone hydrolase